VLIKTPEERARERDERERRWLAYMNAWVIKELFSEQVGDDRFRHKFDAKVLG
jgi:hypothetical protein